MKTKKIDSEEYANNVAKVLKVIAHPVRLQILAALMEKNPLNVSELSSAIALDVEQSLLSHHVIKMKETGILSCKKQGMYVYYSIVDKKLFKILDCMESCDIV